MDGRFFLGDGFIFCQELVEIHAGVASLEVGDAFGERLFFGELLVEGLGVLLFEEDVDWV